MEQRIVAPSSEDFRRGLIAFVQTVGAVAVLRSQHAGPRRMGYVARHLADEFTRRLAPEDARAVVLDFDDARSALGALFEEFVYIACRYRAAAEQIGITVAIPGNTIDFDEESGDPLGRDVIEEIETVRGSIAKLLEKLPRWAQRLIEALMEVLKLTRGG